MLQKRIRVGGTYALPSSTNSNTKHWDNTKKVTEKMAGEKGAFVFCFILLTAIFIFYTGIC